MTGFVGVEGALRASRLFGALPADVVAPLARVAARKRYDRRATLWRAGDPAASFTIIIRGLVEIVRQAPDGSDAILAIFGPRESVGDMVALEHRPYPADAIAITEVDVLGIPADAVLEAMRVHPQVTAAVNASLVEHTRALQQKIRIMTAGAVPRRLATLLIHLVERFGDEMEGGAVFVPVVLSRNELARTVGATLETTIRTTSRWKKQRMVDTTPEGFVVRDLEALHALAVGADRR